MAEVAAAPVSLPMEVDSITSEAAVPAEEDTPEVPVQTSETLYIQNLNEKIRIPGTGRLNFTFLQI